MSFAVLIHPPLPPLRVFLPRCRHPSLHYSSTPSLRSVLPPPQPSTLNHSPVTPWYGFVTPSVTPWKCKIPNVYRPCDGCDTFTPPWVSPLPSTVAKSSRRLPSL